ncbi:MAG: nucleotidyltransferase family protein [Candidatus Marinimicrobia bacterium]|nr:nucleotidyltransferase family protein [Candidatus Neomarinimicrobiota bacterium]
MSVDGVILAAGYSSRAGDFKLGLDLCGKSILQRTVESMSDLCKNIIVVGGHQYDVICDIVKDMPKVKTVKNEHVELGMFFSVKIGIKAVESNRFFIIPGDQPLVKTSTFKTLLEHDDDIVIPRYNGKKGHPALFNSELISEILSWADTEILRNYIHSKSQVGIVDIDDPGIGLDVDTAEDHEKIIKYYKDVFLEEKI